MTSDLSATPRTAEPWRRVTPEDGVSVVTLLTLLDAHVAQRPGLDARDYGDAASYRADRRTIQRQRRDFDALRRAVTARLAIGARELLDACHGGSGRLRVAIRPATGALRVDYVTGQYWPTEYRAAACAVLGTALFDYYRRIWDDTDGMPFDAGRGESAGDYIRRKCRMAVGRGVAGRWCD